MRHPPVSEQRPPQGQHAALELSNITKRFGGLVALDQASLLVRPGTVHAVLGENGAGKTTLMHVAYGMLERDEGSLRLHGREMSIASPADAIAAGIGMVHQHFTLVPAMSVQENLALGGHGVLSARGMRERVAVVAARTGFSLDPDALVEALPVGAQQRVEIAKALVREASVLILDEPTAVLAPPEVDDLLAWLRDYVRAGNAAVLITHKLHEAFAVADDLTVLRRGRVVLSSPVRDTTVAEVSTAMIGTTDTDALAPLVVTPGDVIFAAVGISVPPAHGRGGVRDASFTLRARELVGVVGIEGAGHHELLRALAGRLPVASGSLRAPASVGFVPEDRHAEAVLLDRTLAENVALDGAGLRRGRIRWNDMAVRTAALMVAFDVRGAGPRVNMRSLSGGNQQKLVVARELAHVPSIAALVVENPTRGLDVRASADVHRRLRQACADGATVVMYSSDVDEILSLASRVLVLYAGTVREVPVDREAIGRAMVGVA